MNILALILFIAAIVQILWAIRYFRFQKITCLKYPFFQLRDEIAEYLVQHKVEKEFLRTYKLVHKVTENKQTTNQSQFAVKVTDIVWDNMKKKDRIKDPSKDSLKNPPEMNEFDLKLIQQTLQTARENSFILRFSLSQSGHKMLLNPIIVKLFILLRQKRKMKTAKRLHIFNSWIT